MQIDKEIQQKCIGLTRSHYWPRNLVFRHTRASTQQHEARESHSSALPLPSHSRLSVWRGMPAITRLYLSICAKLIVTHSMTSFSSSPTSCVCACPDVRVCAACLWTGAGWYSGKNAPSCVAIRYPDADLAHVPRFYARINRAKEITNPSQTPQVRGSLSARFRVEIESEILCACKPEVRRTAKRSFCHSLESVLTHAWKKSQTPKPASAVGREVGKLERPWGPHKHAHTRGKRGKTKGETETNLRGLENSLNAVLHITAQNTRIS